MTRKVVNNKMIRIALTLLVIGIACCLIGLINGGSSIYRRLPLEIMNDMRINDSDSNHDYEKVDTYTIKPYLDEIAIEAHAASVEIRPSSSNVYQVKYSGNKRGLKITQGNKKLEIKEFEFFDIPKLKRNMGSKIVLEVPHLLDKVDLNMNAGLVSIENMAIQDLSVDSNVGAVNLCNLQITKKLKLHADVGAIKASLVHDPTKTYVIHKDSDIGKINIDPKFMQEGTGSDKVYIDLDTNVGNINLSCAEK